MRDDLKEILYMMLDHQFHTASNLAELLNISPKTVRNRIKEINAIGKKYYICIESKSRCGYILEHAGEEEVQKILEEQADMLPDTNQARTDYLLAYLLNHSDYTKIEELSDFLCVSRSTLQVSLKAAEEILAEYDIKIERKPNYGICARGSEFDIRRCIGEQSIKEPFLMGSIKLYKQDEMEILAEMVVELIEKYKIRLSERILDHLIMQIYTAMKRIRHGFYIELPEIEDEKRYQTEWIWAEELVKKLEIWQKINYTESEIRYIVIYLAGNKIAGGMDSDWENFVVRRELDGLILKMLEQIYYDYGIEFRNNFNLRMALNLHMVPFDIRMRYNMKIRNPILGDIKKNYVFAYMLASYGCSNVLEKHYQMPVSDDETGYFAMTFALALEQMETEVPKARILIICAAGRGSSQLIRYKYEREFGKYLDKIYVCGVYELSSFDFSKVDYIFTTVPIHQKVPLPIIEVGQFLESPDIVKVRNILGKKHISFLSNYYKEKHFFTEVEGRTKEAALKNICRRIEVQRKLPDGFYEALLQREQLAQTDFGNLTAMPHPHKVLTEETFVYVAILKEQILWTVNPVQFVLLISVGKCDDPHLPDFYEVTSKFFWQKEMIQRVIEEKSFTVLMQMLYQIYYTL